MKRTSRNLVIALVLCLAAVGCKRLLPKPTLAVKSAAEGRQVAMGVGLMPNLDRSFARIGDVAKAMSLPFDATALREKLLTSLKVPPAAAKAIDLATPIAVVLLPPPAPGKEPEAAAALGLSSQDTAKQALESFGKPVATKDDAASFTGPDGTPFWMWRKGTNVVVASSLDALVGGAGLALESLTKSEDDLLVTVNPEAIAKSQGTDVKSALRAWTQQIADASKAGGADTMVAPFTTAILTYLTDKLADVDEARFMVHIDATAGGTLATTLKPKAGSGLANQVAKSTPYALDPAVLTGADPFMLAAMSPSAWFPDMWRTLTPTLLKSNPTLAAALNPLVSSFTGAGSFSIAMAGTKWQQVGVYQLAPNVEPQTFMDQLMSVLKSPELMAFFKASGFGAKMDVARDKNVIAGGVKLDLGKMPQQQAQAMKAMLGDKYQFALTADKGRALFAMGQDARAQLTRLAAGGTANAPSGTIAAAMAETRAADGFFYVDFMQSMRAATASMPASPLLTQATSVGLPMWFSYRGGQAFTFTWRIPMTTVRSAGTLVPLFMALGAAGQMGSP